MRAPFLLLPIALALSAPFPAASAETSRVLFCAGDCFAVDASGLRTPAPKGTTLLPGQRLETGAGSYAQVKVDADNAFGVGERARVRIERDGVFLDEGRIRVIGSDTSRPLELRTDDSVFVLRGADIEMKKSGPTGPASPILVKLNAGEAKVSGDAIMNGGVRLVTAGSVIPGAPLSSTEVAPKITRHTGPVAQASGLPTISLPVMLTPVSIPLPALPALPPVAKAPIVRPPVLVLPPTVRSIPRAPEPSPLPAAPRILAAPLVNTVTGEIVTLNTALILSVEPTYTYKTISPTLTTSLSTSTTTTTSTTTLSSPILTTTTLTSPTTTTTTTYNLLTSPTLSTSTLCCTTLLKR
jgi:hypothetical protein